MRLERRQDLVGGAQRRLQHGVGVEHAGKAHLRQAITTGIGRLAAKDDIGDLRHRQFPGDARHLVEISRRLDEGGVRAGLREGMGPVDGGIDPVDGAGIGAGDDLQILIAPCIDGGLDLGDHLRQRDHLLAGEMAAFLRKDLVFDLDAGGTRPLQHAHRAGHVDRVAEAGIGVDQQRQVDRVGDRGCRVRDLGQRRQPDIGRAQMHIGDAGARDIAGLEALLLDHAREHRVGGAGQGHRPTRR